MTSTRPDSSEYLPYFSRYIDLVPAGDIVEILAAHAVSTPAVLEGLTLAQAAVRYAPDKWSVRQVIGHLSDTERVFAYRALRVARQEPAPAEGFDAPGWMQAAHFDRRDIPDLVAEWRSVRAASLNLFRSLTPPAWGRTGMANGHPISVQALAYIIAGHELHHLALLQRSYGVIGET
ncbi:DinB family protein [Deinococcus sp. KSM4-11]|uniref:DinB family protein n=1 Tax=Deinococcus sp. KSM4-11 TaxID=2568654 RepID=UPI001454DA2C|nr:DinB family protein [Deinococcus sp. KSM4-11]